MLQSLMAIKRYHITTMAQGPLFIPDFSGSMIRGALGHALRFIDERAYQLLFETSAGHAFVITPPAKQKLKPGHTFSFFITLLRSESALHDCLLRALTLALRKGIGSHRTSCEGVSILSEPMQIVPFQSALRLQLISPWYIKYQGKAVLAADLTLANFLIALVQRQRQVVQQGYLELALPSNDALLAWASQITAQITVQDLFGKRYSQRQDSKHPLQGIVGSMDLYIPSIEIVNQIGPLLRQAQWLHGGGKVSFGLGGLAVQPIAKATSQFGLSCFLQQE